MKNLVNSMAAECHQEGGGSHQVLARGAGHIMDPFQGQNCMNNEKLKIRNTSGLISVVRTEHLSLTLEGFCNKTFIIP